MKIVKYLLWTLLLFLVIVAGILLLVLGNGKVLDTTIRTAVSQLGVPLSYEKLSGTVWRGLSLKGVNYDDKVKADLTLKVDYPALSKGVVHIEKVAANNVWIDRDFLASLIDANSSSEADETTSKNEQIKKILVDALDLTLVDTRYHEYTVKRLALHISDFSYDMDKKMSGKIDLSLDSNVAALHSDMTLHESRYNGTIDLHPDRNYLQQFVREQNLTIDTAPHITADVEGDLTRTAFDVTLHETTLHYTTLAITPQLLHLKGTYGFVRKRLDANATLKGTGDAADYDLHLTSGMDLEDLNNTLTYRLGGDLTGARPELAAFLHDENLSFIKPSKIHLDANGTMRQVRADVRLKEGKIKYADYIVEPQHLNLHADYDLAKSYVHASGDGDIFSNAVDMNLTFQSRLNLKRPEKTLKLDLKTDLLPKKPFVSALLAEQNITLRKVPQMHITAVTKGKKILANLQLDPLALETDDLTLESRQIDARLLFDTATQKLQSDVTADVLSNAALMKLDANVSATLTDFNRTLRYNAETVVRAKEAYLKKHLKTKRVDFKKLSPLLLKVWGDAKVLDATVDLSGQARVDRYRFTSRIQNTKVHYDLAAHTVKSDVDIWVDSTYGNLKLKGQAAFDTDDINRTLRYDASLNLRQREPLFDVNLTQLGDIILDANGSLKRVDAKLRSKKLEATVKSGDFNRFDFSLLSQKLYLDRLYLAMPPNLHKSYAALDAKGFYALHEQKADISMQLKALRLAGRDIRTNRFRFMMDGKDFILTPLALRAKGFLMILDAKAKAGEVTAHLNNKAVTANAAFRQQPLFADAKVDIPSIKKLLHEIDKIYPIAPLPKVDGAVALTAKTTQKERVAIKLRSPKIIFPQGRIEKIDLLAYYQPERIDIPTFDFQLRGFKPKKMNRTVHLAHPAFVVLKKGATQIDFVLQDFLSLKAKEKRGVLSGTLKTKKLYLGMAGYGQTRLTTDILFYRSGEQLAISGDVLLSDTEITYESRVLDVSQDPDIMIIKKSKKKAAADNSFTKNTFLDLHIKSVDKIEYKVEAGTIVLKPDIEVRKDFGSKVKLLGKVNILEGEYDFGDKRFQLKEGAIAFRGLEEINPHLDLHVEYPIDEVVIYIDILGDKRKPKLLFKSKPPMSKKDIFSYLLFGFAVSESEGAQSSAASAAEKIFGRALAKDLARELKLDRLDLTRNQLGGIDVKAGKKVNKKTIIYYQNKSLESSAIVERKLGRYLELDVEVGQSSQAVDLFYKKGFK